MSEEWVRLKRLVPDQVTRAGGRASALAAHDGGKTGKRLVEETLIADEFLETAGFDFSPLCR